MSPFKNPKVGVPKTNTGIGMAKVAQSGIKKDSGANVKKESAPVVLKAAAGTPDPMMETMQLMAHALGKLTNQIQDMSGVIKDLQKEGKERSTQATVTPPPDPRAASEWIDRTLLCSSEGPQRTSRNLRHLE
jgi:hypothetical protein